MSIDQKTKIIAAIHVIILSIAEFVQSQIGLSAEELMVRNEAMLAELNQAYGSALVREVLREMAGETKSPLLQSLVN